MEIRGGRAVAAESCSYHYALGPVTGGLFLGLVAVSGFAGPAAQAQDCALSVKIEKGNPVAYQARGNRCEGIYDQPAANRINLRIVGFHLGEPVFDPRKDDAVQLAVRPHEPGRKTLLRIISTRHHHNFQMDTSSIGDDGTFTWPLEVVRRLKEPLRPFETAALACASDCEGDGATLLPVGFSGSVPYREPPVTLTLIAMVDVELDSLTASLRQGNNIIFENLAVGERYRNLLPHQPIRIPIDRVEAGKAFFSLSAVTRRGQRDYLENVLLIPVRGRGK